MYKLICLYPKINLDSYTYFCYHYVSRSGLWNNHSPYTKTKRGKVKKQDDLEYRDVKIRSIESSEGGWSITGEDGWSFWVDKKWSIEPHVGDTTRFYGRGFGFPIRGLDINGRECYYRTPEQEAKLHAREVREYDAEQKAEFKKKRATLDAQYDALPKIFQRRIDKFRRNNPNFRWQYEEYEMFVCTQAVEIAKTLKTADAINAWKEMGFEKQKRLVPALSREHSGNTLGAASLLAILYLQHPDSVVKLYGALAPLVGSKEYGCVPR